jgi:cytoskeletal protein CcmA (bactofilin family)
MKMNSKPAKPSMRGEGLHIDTLIGSHAHFVGEMEFEGAVRIDGHFEGNIRSQKEGTLIVSLNAEVKGEVDVPHLVLHGTVRGNVRASQTLQVGEKGQLNGDVEYTMLTLSEGGAINGRCSRIVEHKEATKPQAVAKPEQSERPTPQAA